MSLRPYIAIFLIAAILNPFCCCNSSASEAEETQQISSCPFCPQPAPEVPPSEMPDFPRDCCLDQEFTDDSESPALAQVPVIACASPASGSDDFRPPPRSDCLIVTTPASHVSGGTPLYVHFCTYLL